MTPEQLKASILQYAIQGKLVEQRPEEGTGEELYQQIQEEKQRLIKEGKIKKEKPLSDIKDDEIPFDIPESWKWVRLEKVIFLLSGSDLESGRYNEKGLGIPYITGASNIDNNRLIINRWTDSPNNIANMGDLLLTCKGTVGKTHILQHDEVHIARQLMAITPILINIEYLHYFIQSSIKTLRTHAKSMIPGIERKNVLGLITPIPPLAEQKRIVARIEELLPYVERYSVVYEKLEQLNAKFPEQIKKSILQYAIQGKLVEQRPEEGTGEALCQQIQEEKQRLIQEGKIKKEKPLLEIKEEEIPFNIPESWKWAKLGNVGSWSAGATPSRNNPAYFGGLIPWLKTGDLNDGYIREVPEYITDLALEKTSIRINPMGSVLMAMYGATIGKLGILEIQATTNQACCACIPATGMNNKYLFYYLMSIRSVYIKMAEGGAQPNISKEKIVNSLIPLPPLGEQKRIVAKIEELLLYYNRLPK